MTEIIAGALVAAWLAAWGGLGRWAEIKWEIPFGLGIGLSILVSPIAGIGLYYIISELLQYFR